MESVEQVKIRMYRQGLGDCFLLTFSGKGLSDFHMLIDCGVLSKAKEYAEKMKEVAKDIKNTTGGKIDVVVATHEHWDHLSGFMQAKEVFETIEMEEIWMAWTENPQDSFAQKLKQSAKTKLEALSKAEEKIKKISTTNFNTDQNLAYDKYVNAFEGFFSFYGMEGSDKHLSLNATTEAFDLLKNKKNVLLRYLEPKNNSVFEPKGLPGIRVYVLGPPKDEKALEKMNPTKGKSEVYELNFQENYGLNFCTALTEDQDQNRPFSSKYEIGEKSARNFYTNYFERQNDWRTIEEDWLYSAGNLALVLDNAINNTSLVLAFEFIENGKVLLFPGDAQVGNWLSWYNYSWEVTNNGIKQTVTVEDLLKRTVFYKVGHHGSHNATLKAKGLEKMESNKLFAMIPVDRKMAEERGWKMPFESLLEELEKKAKMVYLPSPNDINKFHDYNI